VCGIRTLGGSKMPSTLVSPIISDSDLTWELFAELVAASPHALRNAVDDAHLAGIAISRGATLASFDSDFRCYVEHGLRWEDLAAD
jgi:predicted nucleic acid-binding protein